MSCAQLGTPTNWWFCPSKICSWNPSLFEMILGGIGFWVWNPCGRSIRQDRRTSPFPLSTMCRYKVKIALSNHCECMDRTQDLPAPWLWAPCLQNWKNKYLHFNSLPRSIAISYRILHYDKNHSGYWFVRCQFESVSMTHHCAVDRKLQSLFPRMLMAGDTNVI